MRRFRKVVMGLLVWGLLMTKFTVFAFPLTPEQRERLKKYVPRTFEKLEGRKPVYAVSIGDSVTWGVSVLNNDPNHGNSLLAYPGVFLDRLSSEFFYPGAVRLLNPPKGIPEKIKEHLGDEILFENLAVPGRCMVDGMQKVTTEVFVHDPDLVMINYGINDAVRRLPIDQYKRALQYMIDACKSRRSDVIVVAPNLVNAGGGAIDWGLTRPYSLAARDVAESNGVLFVDLGKALARWGGAQVDGTDPEDAMELVHDRLRRIMDWGEEVKSEILHPNLKAHEYMGLTLFEDLLNGPETSDYTLTGNAEFLSESQVKVSLSLRNQTNELRTGTIGALNWDGKLEPVISEIDFILPGGKNKVIEFLYKRPVVGTHPDGSDYYGPWEATSSEMGLSFILSDTKGTEILEPRGVKLSPVSVSWKNRFTENVSDSIELKWNFVNGSQKPVNGKYRIGMGEVIAPAASFSVPPLGDKEFYANFPFQPVAGAARFQRNLFIEVEVDGKKFRFDRELEASKDLVLGEKVAFSPYSRYAVGPPRDEMTSLKGQAGMTLRADADANALFLVVDLENVPMQDLGDDVSLAAEFYIDARPQNEVRTFGFVEKIRVEVPFRDGPGETQSIQLGVFGNGYNMRLDPIGIPSVLKTVSANMRRLEIRIPREYLFRHEWQVGSADSILGIKSVVYLAERDPKTQKPRFPNESQFVMTAPNINLDGANLAGLYYRNALSLQTLHLSRTPLNTWSVRIF